MQDHHRFIDEAGDMTFYSGRRSNRTPAMGSNGVSRCFMIGFVHVKQDLNETRRTIEAFSANINSDPFSAISQVCRQELTRDGRVIIPMPVRTLQSCATNSLSS